jgi:hypothetical protein
MHHRNCETNPGSAVGKREDVVSGVRFSTINRHKAGLNLLRNEPKDGQPFRSMENSETALARWAGISSVLQLRICPPYLFHVSAGLGKMRGHEGFEIAKKKLSR